MAKWGWDEEGVEKAGEEGKDGGRGCGLGKKE